MALVQNMCGHITLPTELSWIILVLLLKVNVDTWGIGILVSLWKVVEAIIETNIKTAVMFHDVLYGFHACRGTGTAIMEINMDQELASIDQAPLFIVFLDTRKS